MNDPRASLLVPFASPWQLRSGTGPNWDPSGTCWGRKDRGFPRSVSHSGIHLPSSSETPSLPVPMAMLKVHQIVEALKSRGRRAGELASGEGCLILLPTPAYGFK